MQSMTAIRSPLRQSSLHMRAGCLPYNPSPLLHRSAVQVSEQASISNAAAAPRGTVAVYSLLSPLVHSLLFCSTMTATRALGLKNPSSLPLPLAVTTPTPAFVRGTLQSPLSSAANCHLCCRVLFFFHPQAVVDWQGCSAAAQFPGRAHALTGEAVRHRSTGCAGKQRSRRFNSAGKRSLSGADRGAATLCSMQRRQRGFASVHLHLPSLQGALVRRSLLCFVPQTLTHAYILLRQFDSYSFMRDMRPKTERQNIVTWATKG